MAKNIDIPVDNTPVELTGGDVSAIRVQNKGSFDVELMASVSSVPPVDWSGSYRVPVGETLFANVYLDQVFPGVANAKRIFARCARGSTLVSVSHA